MSEAIVKSLIRLYTAFTLLLFLLSGQAEAALTKPASAGRAVSLVPFVANEGQVNSDAAFYTMIPGATLWVTWDGEIMYGPAGGRDKVIKETFVGSLEKNIKGGLQADTLINYYAGSDPSRWRESVRTYRNIEFGSIYDHIDLKLVARGGSVEKVFTVHPGGDASLIRCSLQNARGMNLSDSGHLIVLSDKGEILFTPPFAYQLKDGRRLKVSVSYTMNGREYGFKVGEYDSSLPLVIDPLVASTYIGGKSNETAYALEISGGDVMVAGTADSGDFPGMDDNIDVLGDAFVVRVDPDLSVVRAATYFGGSMTDGIRAIALAGTSIYAAGYNNSPNFPTTSGAAYSGTDVSGAFIVRMDSSTLRITSATSFYPNVFGIAWSPADGNVFIAGATGNTGFPIAAADSTAFQPTHKGGADSFVAVLNEDLTTLKGATFLGGEGFDIIYDLAVDRNGYPLAAGVTNSAGFPVSQNAFGSSYSLDWEATHQWIDGFVARLSPDLSRLESATYLGGGSNDNITAVQTEGSLVLVGGNTTSADFPCASTFGPVDGNDAFVALLSEDLSRMKACSVFGGSRSGSDSPESVSDVAFHPSGSIFAVGKTNADDFPTTPGAFSPHPFGSYFGSFIIAFNRDMSKVEASTLIRGDSEDLKAVAFDAWGSVFVAGDTSGSKYPVTAGALQTRRKGGDDLVVSRFTSDLTGPHIEVVPDILDFDRVPVGMEEPAEIVLYNTGGSELRVNDLDLTSGTPSAFGYDNPCRYIPAFGSCSVKVFFKPALTDAVKGGLFVYSNDPFQEQVVVDLKGRGVEDSAGIGNGDPTWMSADAAHPRMVARPDPCRFGESQKGRSVLRTVTVTNTGRGELYLSRVMLESGESGLFRIEKDTCSGNVLAGVVSDTDPPSHCEVGIVFTPKGEGDARGSLRFTSNDPSKGLHTILLSGTGIESSRSRYPGFWGWVAILVLILRIVLGLPVSASGWGRWMGKK